MTKTFALHRSQLLRAGCAVLLAGAAAAAQAEEGPRFYVGALTGVTAVGARDYDVQDDNDRDSTIRASYGAYAGVRVAQIPVGRGWPVSIEGGYVNFNRSTIWYKTSNGDTPVTTEGYSAYVAARMDARIVAGLSVYGKLGASFNNIDSSVPAGYATRIDLSGDKTGVLAGVGVQYLFKFGLGVHAEFTSYGPASPGADAAGFRAGVSYHF